MAVSGLGPNPASAYGYRSKNPNSSKSLFKALGIGGNLVAPSPLQGIERYSPTNGSQDTIWLTGPASAASVTYGPNLNVANVSPKVSSTTKNSEGEYCGVTYDIEDPEKFIAVKMAIQKALSAGTNLQGLHMISTASEDKFLGAVYGDYINSKKTVRFRHSLDWKQLSEQIPRDYPVWREKVFGGPAHLALHEIGHHAHANSATRAQYRAAKHPFDKQMQESITDDLGHPYPAKCPQELIAEMYAAKVGAGKTFSRRLEKLYSEYGGPKVKLPARV